MNVLVDNSVWVTALGKSHGQTNAADQSTAELSKLIGDGRVVMIGPIRQAILSGLKNDQQFQAVAEKLAAFPDLPVHRSTYELAAELCNQCRRAGIPGEHQDFLITAAAVENDIALYTRRPQFTQYARYSLLKLYKG